MKTKKRIGSQRLEDINRWSRGSVDLLDLESQRGKGKGRERRGGRGKTTSTNSKNNTNTKKQKNVHAKLNNEMKLS